MLEVLAYLFEQFYNADGLPDMSQLAKKLSLAGFEGEDIHDALTWLSELKQIDVAAYQLLDAKAIGFRSLHPIELERLSEEAALFLHALDATRVLSAGERELVLDRLWREPDGEVALERIKLIVLMVIWQKRDALSNLLIEELLFGREGFALH
jgi:Smg protein